MEPTKPSEAHQTDLQFPSEQSEEAKIRAMNEHNDFLNPHECPPTTASNSVSLRLGETIIHKDLEFHVRAAASSPELRAYMARKYHWDDWLCDCIDWFPHGRALANCAYSKRVTITKFIHGWLPINKRLHEYDKSVPTKCATCNEPVESQQHFLYCNCDSRHAHRTLLRSNLEEWVGRKAPPAMKEILLKGLFEWAESNRAILPPNIDNATRSAAMEQEKIGWHQLWRGRLSTKWGDIFAQHRTEVHKRSGDSTTLGISAEEWTRQFIKRVWTGVLEMWEIRNTAQHNQDMADSTTTARLASQIKSIFDASKQLSADAQAPFQTPMDQILKLPLAAQKNWITIHQSFIKQLSKRTANNATANTRDIRSYFPVKLPPTSTATSHDDKPP